MNSTHQLHRSPTDWLHESQLASYVDALTQYLSERGYAPYTIDTNLGCVAHFGRWMSQCGHERTGRPLGSESFIEKASKILGRDLKLKKPGPKPIGN